MRISGARAVTPGGVMQDATIEVVGSQIASVGGSSGAASSGDLDAGGAWVLPGFIDLHMHGGGGHDVTSSLDDMAAAVRFHRGHGTTRTLVSLVTAPVDALERQLGWAAALTRDGLIAGSHLEGPFLSAVRCGAQNPSHLLVPSREVLTRFRNASGDTLKQITLAPELPGAVGVVEACVEAGIVAAVGHSDATYDDTRRALDAGASLATHLFNGMRPLHHREPGIIGAVLESAVPFEIINDGIHLHPAIVRLVSDHADRVVFITDAIDATGMGDGTYVLGGQSVTVSSGEARLDRTGSLAGSTLTMDQAVRNAVRSGIPIEVASRAASANPALMLGLDGQVGELAAGQAADLVVLDDDLQVQRVMMAGEWIAG